MNKPFGAESTTDDVLAGVDLHGRRVLVTGVSAGLGVETARVLAAHGAHVLGAARDLGKAEAATTVVRDAARAGGGEFELIRLDLADLSSVRACADALLERGDRLDLLVNNAGVMATPQGRTTDGFETQFGTNHLGHFVLANRLAPLLGPGSRLVSLSSAGHRFSDVDLDDPGFERTPYDPWVAYGRSKTANILFAVEFDRRHRGRGVRAVAVHPGGIVTELARHLDPAVLEERRRKIDADRAARGEEPFRYKSVPQGAATSVWAGVVADTDTVGGRYCEDCRVAEAISPDRPTEATAYGVRAYAVDPASASALWARSEEWVGERFEEMQASGHASA
ncbi:SDR family NAD(P)-dependent oxidoreductase [Rhizosaccharibacter radicis]|uniref:SDR family NAD(P)-dependent oxidoreductase n=1 Tax=Rhizosaccharibacter radicis TaxID=2782605 RepID=A0ABT1VZD2_9PROT|nr:SDR family NAD(P)-dependent oxidoreductase [Acetobacteraceae bacterium KSS12]